MANLTRSQAQTILSRLGWRVNTSSRLTQAIKDFQRGWNLGDALTVDGVLGPKTSYAMRLSESRRAAGRTTASANFSFKTMQCRCYKRSAGRYASCRVIFMTRKGFQMAERYRKHNGAFSIVSACRCPSRNAAVGGSSTSRHVVCSAVDVPMTHSVTWVKSRGIATHIGWNYSGGYRRVKHIDMGGGYTVWNPLVYKD